MPLTMISSPATGTRRTLGGLVGTALIALGSVMVFHASPPGVQSLYVTPATSAGRTVAYQPAALQPRASATMQWATPSEQEAEAASETPEKAPPGVPQPNPNEYDFTEVNRLRGGGRLNKGQPTAIAAGVLSVLLGAGYLLVVQFLDSREILPPPPEAMGL